MSTLLIIKITAPEGVEHYKRIYSDDMGILLDSECIFDKMGDSYTLDGWLFECYAKAGDVRRFTRKPSHFGEYLTECDHGEYIVEVIRDEELDYV